MNANAAPINPATAAPTGPSPARPQTGNHFAADAVYKGYDLMVRKFATHIIREAMVTTTTRADLVRAISSPAVTFAASAADGAILISCPDSLPDLLTTLAEPLDHGPSPTAATDALAQMLDQMDRKLDGMLPENTGFERISDRLEAIEYSLRELPDPEADSARTRALEAALDQIGHRLDMVLDRIAQIPDPVPLDTMPLELMLAASESRLLTAIQIPVPPQDLSPVIDAIHRVTDQIAAIPGADQALARVESKLDQLADRPVPTPDLSAHHLALSGAADGLALLAQRLDLAVEHLPDAATLADHGTTLSNLAACIADTPTAVAVLLATRLDFSPLAADIAALQQAVSQTALASLTTEGLAELARQVAALADRPQPLLDLTEQNQSLTQVAATLDSLGQRVATLTQITATGPDLTALAAQYETVLTTLGQPAQQEALTATLTQIADLAARPQPQFDLSGPVQTLADLTATLGNLAQSVDILTELAATGPDLTSLARHYDSLMTALGQPAQSQTVASGLAGLAAQIADLAARPTPLPDLSEPVQSLSRIAAAQTDLSQQLQQLAQSAATSPQIQAQFDTVLTILGQPAQNDPVTRALTDLAASITHLMERPEPPINLPELNLPDLAAPLADMAQRLDGMTQALSRAPDQSLIAASFDKVLNAIGQTAQDASLTRSTDQLNQIFRQLKVLGDSVTTAPDLAALLDKIDAGVARLGQPAQHAAVTALMADLTERLDNVADRPDPVIDMTAQRQSLARFGTALAHAVERLEQVAGTMSTGPNLAPVLARFDTLQADLAVPDARMSTALSGLADQIADLALRTDPVPALDLHGQTIAAGLDRVLQGVESLIQGYGDGPDITAMLLQLERGLIAAVQTHGGAAMAGPLADLSAQLADLASRPDPVFDLSGQRQDFADVAGLLAGSVQRLEIAAKQITFRDDKSLINAKLDALRAGLADQAPVPALMAEVAGQMAVLLARPDMSQDIVEQKHNLGDFAKGLADLVQWLEPVTRDLASGPDFGAILAEFDLLRSDLNLPARDLALQQAFADLSVQIADLAKSPEGLVSLAEQRRSFASFSNALAFLMQRLDTVMTDPALVLPAKGQDAVAHLTRTVADMTADQPLTGLATTLSTLVLRLDFLIAALAPHAPEGAAPPEPVTDPAQLIQDLATATTALARIVTLLEGDQAATTLPQATAASVAELFDRLDAALDGPGGSAQVQPALAQAIAPLVLVLQGTSAVRPGQELAYLNHLRLDFAEFIARTLQAQTGV